MPAPDDEPGEPSAERPRRRRDVQWQKGLDVMISALPLGVYVTDGLGQVVYLSERGQAMTEADQDEHGHYSWVERIHPDDRQATLDAWIACVETGASFDQRYRIEHSDGTTHWMHGRGGAVQDDDGQLEAVVGSVEDTTDVQRAQARSQERQRMLDAVLEGSSDLVAFVGPDLRLKFINDAAVRLIGTSSDELVGRVVQELLHPDDVGLVADALAAGHGDGGAFGDPIPVRLRHVDGTFRHVEIVANALAGTTGLDGIVVTARDQTERMLADARARAERDQFRQVFDHAPIGMALVDPTGGLVLCNAALARMVGRPALELIGTSLFELAHPDDRESAMRDARSVLLDDDPRPAQVRFVRTDASIAWAEVTSTVIRDDDSTARHVILHVEDVTERRALRHELEHAALHDPLTGLLNRTGFAASFVAAEVPDTTDGETGALVVIDLDGFKAVNDSMGHAAGDELLIEVSTRLRNCVRSTDAVGRLGGDEFAVHVWEATDASKALGLGERIRSALSEPFELSHGPARIAGSVGVALLHGEVDLPRALAAADVASYGAKRNGGDRVEFTWCTDAQTV